MFLLVNWIRFVLLRFSVNKLACKHLLIFWNIKFIIKFMKFFFMYKLSLYHQQIRSVIICH
jgi:hypothetical protein